MCNGLPAERLTSWGVARRPPTAAARAPEAARGLRRRRDAFQGWPVPRTLRAAAAQASHTTRCGRHLPPSICLLRAAAAAAARLPPLPPLRDADHQPHVSRRAPRAMLTTRARVRPRRCRVAWDGGRAMHATHSPASNEPTVTPSGHEARWRCRRTGRPALCRARWNSTGRPPKVRQASDGRFASSLSTTS